MPCQCPVFIKRSQERTAIILRHIDKMMEYYRIDCDLNGTDEDVRRYKVVMASYIDEPKLSPQCVGFCGWGGVIPPAASPGAVSASDSPNSAAIYQVSFTQCARIGLGGKRNILASAP